MNIHNFTPFTPSWEEIFEKQTGLKFQYEPESLEVFKNFDIDCLEDQEVFKKYCWRITEELCETMEAVFKDGMDHAQEEIIDAMNFSIELMILYGWDPRHFKKGPSTTLFGCRIFDKIEATLYYLGLAANCLKNRQWRKSQYMVDLLVFENRFGQFLSEGYQLLMKFFESDEEIRKAWSLKYQVNLFRIKSNY